MLLTNVMFTGLPVVAGFLRNLGSFNIQDFLITILVLCVSLSFHEFAHAWMAYRIGDDTAALNGRLTMNPLAHLDPIGSLVFLFAGIGWAKGVPINPARFDRRYTIKKGIMMTSLAGPSSNLLLAFISVVLYFLTLTVGSAVAGPQAVEMPVVATAVARLMLSFYQANVVLAVFNLLPVPPLDGFKIFGAALPTQIYYKLMSVERYIGLAFLAIVLLAGGLLGRILSYVRVPFDYLLWKPLEAVFRAIWQMTGLL